MKKIIILFLLFSLTTNSYSQYSGNKHIDGTFSLGGNYGITSNGNVLNFSFTEYFSPKIHGHYALEYEIGKIKTTDYKSIRVIWSYKYVFFDMNSNIFFCVQTGGVGAYELQKNKFLNETDKKLTGGVLGGLEIEGFLSDNFSLTLNAQQLYIINSDIGNLTATATVGVRYSF